MSVEAQRADPESALCLYRAALRLRRRVFGAAELTWRSATGDDVLVFDRPGPNAAAAVRCAVNLGTTSASIVDSDPVVAGAALGPRRELPPDTAALWLLG